MKDPKEMGDQGDNYGSYKDGKKQDDVSEQVPQGGLLWRFGSGLVSTTTGVVGAGLGYGVGAIKVVASTSYGAVSKTAEVGVSATKAVASTGYNAVSYGVTSVTSKIPAPSFQKGKDKKD